MDSRNVVASRKTNEHSYFVSLLGMILCLGAAVSVALVIMSLSELGFSLTEKPILIMLLIDAGLVVLAFWLFVSGKADYGKLMRFACFVLVGLLLFLNLFVTSYLNVTDDFLSGMGVRQGAVEYKIVAQRTAGVKIPAKNTIRAGIQSTDIYKQEAAQATRKITAASFTEYSNVSEMIEATADDEVEIAVVQSSMLDAYREYFPESYDKLDVLATFKTGSKAAASTAGVKIDITKPFAIFVSGIDAYGDIDNTMGRSDANMLVLIDPEHYKVLLISTPRDYYVQLHGTTGSRDKLAHAGTYGIEMTEMTIEDLYGLEIDYHVLTNFDTLIRLVDAMGGIVVDNPTAFNLWGNNYKEGEIYLTGDYALMYARARKMLDGGDNDRGENQQRVIEAIIDRITRPSVVIHYTSILGALSGTFRANIPKQVIVQLFSRQISIGGDWTIEKMSATGTNAQRPTYSMGSQELSVIIPDQSSLDEIRARIRDFMLGTP